VSTDSNDISKIPPVADWPVPPRVRDCSPEVWQSSFDDHKGKFNFLPHTSFQPVMTALIVNELRRRRAPKVLDIGCGHGIGTFVDYQWMIKRFCGDFQGVEPDPVVPIADGLFDRFQRTTLENADLPDSYFDLAYSVFVMEHVSDPAGYFRAAYRVLKPGGSILQMTPNAAAFFGFVSRWLHRAHVDEMLHKLMFKNAEVKPEHYEVASLCNTRREFQRFATPAGFGEPEIAYFQLDGLQGYFPGPTKVVYHALMAKRKLLRSPGALDTMVVRLTRPA